VLYSGGAKLPFATSFIILPPGFPPDLFIANILLKFQPVWTSKVLLVESFPYGTDYGKQLIAELKHTAPETSLQVLFLTKRRRYGATDIDDEDVALKKASEEYEILHPQCVTEEPYRALASSRLSIESYYGIRLSKRLNDLSELIKDFSFEYELSLEMSDLRENFTDAEFLNGICTFEHLRQGKRIIDSYIKNYTQALDTKSMAFNQTIGEFYEGFFKDFPAEVEDGKKELLKRLRAVFEEEASHLDKGLYCPADEISYRSRDFSKMEIDFKRFISNEGRWWKHSIPEEIEKAVKAKYDMLEQKVKKVLNYIGVEKL
jgi:hypothetical protein